LLLPKIEQMYEEGRLSQSFAKLTDFSHWSVFRRTVVARTRAEQNGETPQTSAAVRVGNGATGSVVATGFPRGRRKGGGFPQFLDFYLLRNFLFYFALLLVAFILLFEVFTFFDLLNDIARHRTGIVEVVNYFRYLCCYLFYQLAPLACLVAILVTLGVMTKNNELVAFKAAGVSLYRIALPLLAIGVVFATGLVVLDGTYLPYANQRQNELRNIIRGRPAQTYFRPGRQWIFGDSDGANAKIYEYQLFDPDRQLFGDLNVFELDPQTFTLRRRVYAARAHWEPQQNAWVLESGWVRDFDRGNVTHYTPFPVYELAELDEPPSYFRREVRQAFQMNWWTLRKYIGTLQQAGFDVAGLSVQLQKKLSFPLIAPIIIMLAIPFSILVGTRGALGGVVVGVGLGVVYWAVAALFEAMGAVGQLPAMIAAWSPDAIFFFLGLYFFLKMPT
jgi:LPS export ABC transporter permease LptG